MRNPSLITFSHPMLARPFCRWMLLGAITAIAGGWIAILGVPRIPGGEVVTHFTTTFGIDALGAWESLFRFPATGTALLVLNLAIALLLSPRTVVSTPDASTIVANMRPSAPALLLLVASFLQSAAVLLGCVLLWRVNVGGPFIGGA